MQWEGGEDAVASCFQRASVSEASTKSKDYVREIAGYEGACGERGD